MARTNQAGHRRSRGSDGGSEQAASASVELDSRKEIFRASRSRGETHGLKVALGKIRAKVLAETQHQVHVSDMQQRVASVG